MATTTRVLMVGVLMLLAAPAAAAAEPDGDDAACPSVFLNPWNDLDQAHPACADAWAAELHALGTRGAAEFVGPYEDCDDLPRGVRLGQPVPSEECVARWVGTLEAAGHLVADAFVAWGAGGAEYVLAHSGDADGDGLPGLAEHQVCGRALVDTLVTRVLDLGACAGSGDYTSPG